jgi:phage gp29-like protein
MSDEKKHSSILEDIQDISRKSQALKAQSNVQETTKYLYRDKITIADFRTGLSSAERDTVPNWRELVRVYQEVDKDSQVKKLKTIRQNFVKARDFRLLDENDKENEKATKLFNHNWFSQFLQYALDSQFWGYSLVYIGDIVDDIPQDVRMVERQLVNPKNNLILDTPYSTETGTDYTQPKYNDWYMLLSDTQHSHYTGLYSDISPYQIFLRTVNVCLVDYCERFGMPSVLVSTDVTNAKTLKNMEYYLSEFNRNAYTIVDHNSKYELIEASNNNADSFLSAAKEYKTSIADLIIGTDQIGVDSAHVGSVSQSMDVASLYSKADIKYVEYIVNEQLIPRLIKLGITSLTGTHFKFNETEKIDNSQEFDMLIALLGAGKDVPNEWIEKQFGIPVENIEIIKEDTKTPKKKEDK